MCHGALMWGAAGARQNPSWPRQSVEGQAGTDNPGRGARDWGGPCFQTGWPGVLPEVTLDKDLKGVGLLGFLGSMSRNGGVRVG